MPAKQMNTETTEVDNILSGIQGRIAQGGCGPVVRRPLLLKALRALSDGTRYHGYPEPEATEAVIYLMRQEKFRLVRESGKSAPVVEDIQSMIDELKLLVRLAYAARQEKTEIQKWINRPWERTSYTGVCVLIVIDLVFIISLLAGFSLAGLMRLSFLFVFLMLMVSVFNKNIMALMLCVVTLVFLTCVYGICFL